MFIQENKNKKYQLMERCNQNNRGFIKSSWNTGITVKKRNYCVLKLTTVKYLPSIKILESPSWFNVIQNYYNWQLKDGEFFDRYI